MRRGGGFSGAAWIDTEGLRRQIDAAGVEASIGEQLLGACELGAMMAINDRGDTDGEGT
ncbi:MULTISPECIES: hypothetical protein [unclassified Devosia]|uniref:hypothetical protein n=1 Tax=unclassified Devosia TaxID=196773 RepID=UPI001AC10F18|nr:MULTISPECIES: hypothetical protein [unclassified Devosia]MBN9304113.1 hypothetical protein [Devosia sp.]